MDERLQFVARRLADGGTLQGVRHFTQDRLQDLRSLSGLWHSGAHRQEPPSVPLCQPTSFPGGKLCFECEARAPQLGCSENPRALDPQIFRYLHPCQKHHSCGTRSPRLGRAARPGASSCARNCSLFRAAAQRAVVHRLQRRVPAGKSPILLPADGYRPPAVFCSPVKRFPPPEKTTLLLYLRGFLGSAACLPTCAAIMACPSLPRTPCLT